MVYVQLAKIRKIPAFHKEQGCTYRRASSSDGKEAAGCRFALARSRVPDFGAMTTAEEGSARAGGGGLLLL